MRIKMSNSDKGGCYYYRVYLPFQELKRNNIDIDVNQVVSFKDMTGYGFFDKFPFLIKPFGDLAEKIFNFRPQYNLFVVQRNYSEGFLKNMLYIQGRGAKIVYEIDDNLLDLHKSNPASKYYSSPESQAVIKEYLKRADAVTVTTEYLKKLYKQYNSNIFVLPNCLRMDQWNTHFEAKKAVQNEENKGIIRIGYAGSGTHAIDYYVVREVIPEILRSEPNTRMKFIGFDWSKVFPEQFKGLEDRIDFVGWAPIADYPKNLYDVDIGIGPLVYSEFNRAKSNIKFLEYSALGIPMVATDIEPYSEIENDFTGIKIRNNSKAQWLKALKKLIRNKTVRERIGENARQYVIKKYDIKDNWEKWLMVYGDVLTKGVRNGIEPSPDVSMA